jgi:uncharacterized membrane protein HdeD (DUF308 family)
MGNLREDPMLDMPMRTMTATDGPADATGTVRANPKSRRPSLWCGLFLIACGIMAAALPASERNVAHALGYLLLAAGAAEGAAGLLDRRGDRAQVILDFLLGLVSVSAGAMLLQAGDQTAWAFMSIIAVWLLTRGGLDVLASFLMPNLYLEEGRSLRAAADLVLGLVCWIGVEMVAWLEPLLGWPPTSVDTAVLFAAISLGAAGIFLLGASAPLAAIGGVEPTEPGPRHQA